MTNVETGRFNIFVTPNLNICLMYVNTYLTSPVQTLTVYAGYLFQMAFHVPSANYDSVRLLSLGNGCSRSQCKIYDSVRLLSLGNGCSRSQCKL